MVTGDVGVGKTVAVRAALAQLDPSRTSSIYLGNPVVGGRGLYAGIVTPLGRFRASTKPPRSHRSPTCWPLRPPNGRAVVIALDEAQLVSVDVLEELRLLTNADMASRGPSACLLVGQPTVRRRIKLGTFAARTSGSRCAKRHDRRDQDLPQPPPAARRP